MLDSAEGKIREGASKVLDDFFVAHDGTGYVIRTKVEGKMYEGKLDPGSVAKNTHDISAELVAQRLKEKIEQDNCKHDFQTTHGLKVCQDCGYTP